MIDTSCERAREVGVPAPAMKRRRPMVAKVRKIDGDPRLFAELIASLEPENEAQAALAIHVACLHTASLNVLSRTPNIGERNMIAMATACAKLEHAFHNAIET